MLTLHVQKLIPGPTLVCIVSYAGCIRTATVTDRLIEGHEYGQWQIGGQEIRLRCRNGEVVAELKSSPTEQVRIVEASPSPWQFVAGR